VTQRKLTARFGDAYRKRKRCWLNSDMARSLRDVANNANQSISGCSGNLLPPSRQNEKNTASQDQAGQASTDDRGGHGRNIKKELVNVRKTKIRRGRERSVVSGTESEKKPPLLPLLPFPILYLPHRCHSNIMDSHWKAAHSKPKNKFRDSRINSKI